MSNLLEKASILTTPTAYENGKILSVKPSVVLGEELVINGGFDTDSDWNKETGWSISNGNASRTNTGTYTALQQNILTTGKKYKITIQIKSISSGSIFGVRLGTNYILQGTLSSEGVYTGIGLASNATLSIMGDPTFTGSIDNISVKEAIDADFDFTRNSSATRVNSQGLIEDITANLPRIDYTGGVGHWLFEPQSTNTATYSNDFTQGDIFVSSSSPQAELSVATSLQAISL